MNADWDKKFKNKDGKLKGGVKLSWRRLASVYEYVKFVQIDSDENILVPVHVFDNILVAFNKAFKGLFVVGTSSKIVTYNVSGNTDNFRVAHYTSVESLKKIVSSGRIKANVGIYGPGVYVTTASRARATKSGKGGGLQAVAASIFDSTGVRAALSGKVSACVTFEVKGRDLMRCNSRGWEHVGFVFKGDMDGPASLDMAPGKSYKKMKQSVRKSVKEGGCKTYPDVILKDMKVRKQSETRFCAPYNS